MVVEKSATLDYDGAHSTISEPLNAYENGKFEVAGVHIEGQSF